jgi:CubicO group peptidase (beta-lactamase class C family)
MVATMSLEEVTSQAAGSARLAVATLGSSGVLETTGPVGDRFELASITKLLVSCAVLVAVEDGSLRLDDPAGPPGSTVRHLLAHASGLDATTDAVLMAPGTRRIYSNSGFELLGATVAEATGLPVEVLVRETVLEPLGMSATTFGASAATGAVGTVLDLARFASDLMQDTPTIMAGESLQLATTVAFPGLSGVLPGFGPQRENDWGLGFELKGTKSPHWAPDAADAGTFGHFGRSGSLLWIDPTLPASLIVLGDRPFGPWAPPVWRRLGEHLLAGRGRDETLPSRQDGLEGADGNIAVVDPGESR